MGPHDLTGREQQFQHAYEASGWGCRISRVRNIRSNMHTMYQVGLQAPTGWELQIYMPTRYQGGAAWSRGQGTTVPTCIRGIRMGLQELTGKEHQIEHAYNVSGRGCRISRVGNYRSYMPTRHQEGTLGSHGFETSDRWLPIRCQDGVAWSHGLGTTDRTCLLGIKKGLQDLTGSKHQIERAY